MWHSLLTTTTTAAAVIALTAVILIVVPTPARPWCRHQLARLGAALTRRLHEVTARPERGDVPGWVMVTLMTAGLVAIIWVLADDWLRQLFQQAVDRVNGP